MNNVLNNKMRELLFKQVIANYELSPALQQLLIEGFVCHNECYFLQSLYEQQSHVKTANFTDPIAHECFINSIHIDDYVSVNILEHALLFADQLIHKWHTENNEGSLKLILAETDFGFNLKFHLCRENADWLNENDIDKFKEALLLFNSDYVGQ